MSRENTAKPVLRAVPAVAPDETASRLLASAPKTRSNPPRLALTPVEAAFSLGISRDSFDRYVKPELRLVRRGRLVVVPVAELAAWLDREGSRLLDDIA